MWSVSELSACIKPGHHDILFQKGPSLIFENFQTCPSLKNRVFTKINIEGDLSPYLTNLMHKICLKISFISCLYMFRAHVLIIRRSKFCALSWLNTEINILRCTVSKTSKYTVQLVATVINQLDAQSFWFTISLSHASTCFEHMCSSSGGQNCITQPLVSSHL